MKKVLVAALLAALVATPAMAGLTPPSIQNPTRVVNTSAYSLDGAAPRGYPYAPNNPLGVYDNMIVTASGFGNGPSTFTLGGIIDLPAGAFMCDDMTLRPGTTAIGSAGTGSGGIDWVYNNAPQGAGVHGVTIAFFNNPGGADTTLGTTIAAFTFGTGGAPNGYFLLSAGLPSFAVGTTDIWVCIAHSVPTRHFFSGDPVDGAPGTANPGSLYQGSSDNIALVFGGTVTPFFFSGSGAALANANWALQGSIVPEPSVAGLLVIGGLLALRRRKA